MLRAFGALPGEQRVQEMTDRDYLWCVLNLMLDEEELLDRLCPQCRMELEQERCPICGDRLDHWAMGQNDGFDWERFESLRREKQR